VRNPSSTYGFTVNNNGRNASASLNAGSVGAYLYNAFEQRAQKVAGGVTIQFVYDLSGHLIAESNGSGVEEGNWGQSRFLCLAARKSLPLRGIRWRDRGVSVNAPCGCQK
jgi:YD repeat-containing protein